MAGLRRLVAAVTVVALLVVSFGGLYVADVRGMCRTEDSAHCVWFGAVQGNGRGATVVNA